MKTAAALLLLLLLTASCTTTTNTGIGQIVEPALRAVPDVPGIGVAVVRDGKPYFAGGFGYADVEHRIPAGAGTGYYIASSTKSYTGLACAILAERGLVDLDAPITKVLPEVTLAPPLDANKITLRQFLTHTSGIENDAIVFRTAYSGEHTPQQLVSLLNHSTPIEPGFHYDNLGYVVASLVMERVTGKPWQRVLDELVFKPLGMDRTTSSMSEAEKSPLAVPYALNREAMLQRLDFEKNDAMMHAAGGIVTTPADLVRWLEANIDDGKIGSSQAIDPAAFRDAHRKQVDVKAERGRFHAYGYGLGWYQARLDDHEVLFHLGGFPGWQTHVSFMPEARIGVAVVTNASGPALPLIDFIAASIYDRLLDKPEAGAAYDRGLAELKTALDHGRARYAAAVQERAKRPWMLRHPNAAYAGVYENPDWGTLRIEQRDGKLVASLAHLSSVLEAFTQPETARIELVPGNGDVLRFTFGDGDTADTVHMGKLVFQRVQ